MRQDILTLTYSLEPGIPYEEELLPLLTSNKIKNIWSPLLKLVLYIASQSFGYRLNSHPIIITNQHVCNNLVIYYMHHLECV